MDTTISKGDSVIVWDIDNDHSYVTRASDVTTRMIITEDGLKFYRKSMLCTTVTFPRRIEKAASNAVYDYPVPLLRRNNTLIAVCPFCGVVNKLNWWELTSIDKCSHQEHINKILGTLTFRGDESIVEAYYYATLALRDARNTEQMEAASNAYMLANVDWNSYIIKLDSLIDGLPLYDAEKGINIAVATLEHVDDNITMQAVCPVCGKKNTLDKTGHSWGCPCPHNLTIAGRKLLFSKVPRTKHTCDVCRQMTYCWYNMDRWECTDPMGCRTNCMRYLVTTCHTCGNYGRCEYDGYVWTCYYKDVCTIGDSDHRGG